MLLDIFSLAFLLSFFYGLLTFLGVVWAIKLIIRAFFK